MERSLYSFKRTLGGNYPPETVLSRTFAGLIIGVRERQNPMRAPPKNITTDGRGKRLTKPTGAALTECETVFLFEAKNPAHSVISIGEALESSWFCSGRKVGIREFLFICVMRGIRQVRIIRLLWPKSDCVASTR